MLASMDAQLAVLFEEYEERLETYVGQSDGFARALFWYLTTGTSLGFTQAELQEPFAAQPAIAGVIAQADAARLLDGKPAPVHRRGDLVKIDEQELRISKLNWNNQSQAWDYYATSGCGRDVRLDL